MNPSPIHRVLSTFRTNRVRALLMGGQACILYGAAEFSRDVDVAVLADERNLHRLQRALDQLRAEPVFVPPLGGDVLRRGHACHFRCRAAGVDGLRIDVMSVLHGCEPFERLWARRKTLRLPAVGSVHLLALPDLVQAKKTQRDKDWPMLRRLVEADYHQSTTPSRTRVRFWLRELRTSDLLIALCHTHPATTRRLAASRPALRPALRGDAAGVERALQAEQETARRLDKAYWQPLRAELSRWRRQASEIG